jgi:hypothetical protein
MRQTFTLSSVEVARIVFDHLQNTKKLTGQSYDSTSMVRSNNAGYLNGYEITFIFEEIKTNE